MQKQDKLGKKWTKNNKKMDKIGQKMDKNVQNKL